jgi:hypothetical protein
MFIVARDLIGGQAETYGLILGPFGIGATVGALLLPFALTRFSKIDATALWKERFQCAIWLDYLWHRSLQIVADLEAQSRTANSTTPRWSGCGAA